MHVPAMRHHNANKYRKNPSQNEPMRLVLCNTGQQFQFVSGVLDTTRMFFDFLILTNGLKISGKIYCIKPL